MDGRFRKDADSGRIPIDMKSLRVLRLRASFAATVTVDACSGADAPKTPLGAADSGTIAPDGAMVPAIQGEAKAALDSGNILFRAKAYGRALAQYRRSADLAPAELAPLLGIMMVADVTKDSRLRGATLSRIRKLDPAAADSSAAIPHSRMIEAHPRAGGSAPPR
jgi:hypothetical protein